MSFIDCTLDACDLLILNGADASFTDCDFLHSGAAVCAAGTGTRVSLAA